MLYICQKCPAVWDFDNLPKHHDYSMFGDELVKHPAEASLECPDCGMELEEYHPLPLKGTLYGSPNREASLSPILSTGVDNEALLARLKRKVNLAYRWYERMAVIKSRWGNHKDKSLVRYMNKMLGNAHEEMRVANLNYNYVKDQIK